MSVKASTWAWEQQIPPYDKLVLLELADHADDKGRCWPKQGTIAERTGVHRVTVNRAIKRMVDLGLLSSAQRRRAGSQRSNMYQLNIGIMLIPCSTELHSSVVQGYTTELHKATHRETSVESSVETSSTGKPGPEETVGTVKQEIEKHKPLPEDEILPKAHRDSKGVLKPSACAYLWREYRRTFGASGFQPEILVEELGFLKKAHKRVGEDNFVAALKAVMRDWIGFTKFAQDKGGAFQLPQTPKIKFFLKFCAEAVEFASLSTFCPTQDWVQPIAKPLTLPEETVENGEPALSHDEVLAINKEFED